MARDIDADFLLLKGFLDNYNLESIGQTASQLGVVKMAHKAYLPFLQFWSICSDEAKTGGFALFGQSVDATSQEFAHLREAVSDIGSGFFCCLHGAYKPGYMALRSSIENFLRFSASHFDIRALTTTSIYELFELARSTEPFAGSRVVYIDRLRSSYSELCKYTHSASLAHMAGIHALAHFPSFDEKAFDGWLQFAKSSMSAMAAVTTLGYPSIYLNAHFSAVELLDHLIPQADRLVLLRGKSPSVIALA